MMRRNVTGFAVLVVGLAGFLAVAQTPRNPTRISDAAVAPPPTSFTALWVVTPTGKVLVQPDASIKIDLTANPPTIRAVLPPGSVCPVEKVDQSVAAAGQMTFALTAPPVAGTPVKVYKNGLLQWQSADYSLIGQVVTFLPEQDISPGDYVQIAYWK